MTLPENDPSGEHSRNPTGLRRPNTSHPTRRRFLETLAASAGALLLGNGSLASRPVRLAPLQLALVLPQTGSRQATSDVDKCATDVERGVVLGVEESRRTAELLGRSIELSLIRDDSGATELIDRQKPAGVIGGLRSERCLELADAAARAGSLFFNVVVRDDALRAADCRSNMFHLEAGDATYENARRSFRQKHDAEEVVGALWHPDLFRYGAAQLNERFEKRFDAAMTGPAWAGWMAVKVLWEASIRSRSAAAEDLSSYLADPERRFDGHKGWPLSFHEETRQLRQPLYLVEPSADGRLLGEVPLRDEEGTPADQLDELMQSGRDAECRSHPAEP